MDVRDIRTGGHYESTDSGFGNTTVLVVSIDQHEGRVTVLNKRGATWRVDINRFAKTWRPIMENLYQERGD